MFCPHSVFICFLWISEQTAIISLYSINWLAFITETESVLCHHATRTYGLLEVHLHAFLTSVLDDFVCRGLKSSGGLLWVRWWTLRMPRKTERISCPDEQQDMLISVQASSVPPAPRTNCTSILRVSVVWRYNNPVSIAVPENMVSPSETSDGSRIAFVQNCSSPIPLCLTQ
jgi:hypothetical protein